MACCACAPLRTVRAAIEPWAPHLYALFWMLLAPSAVYAAAPLYTLRYFYYIVSGAYAFVALWVLLETCISLVSTIYLLACAKHHLVRPRRPVLVVLSGELRPDCSARCCDPGRVLML
jgi:hypothetical protein